MPQTGQLHPWLAWSLPELYFILLQGDGHLTLPGAALGSSAVVLGVIVEGSRYSAGCRRMETAVTRRGSRDPKPLLIKEQH